MFEPLEVPSLASWWRRYLVQFFLCYPAAWVIGTTVSPLVSSLGIGNHGPIRFAGYDCLLLLGLGSIVGWQAASLRPRLKSAGQWIWVLPVVILIADIIGGLRRPIPWPSESLFATPGEGVIGPYLIGLPAFASAGYSLSLALSGKEKESLAFPPRRILAGFGVVIGVLALVLHGFEQARMEKWSKIRNLMTNSGIFLTHDPVDLCANPESGERALSRWEFVETLGERRACEGNRLLSNDDPGPRSFVVDRVRILTGPSTGAEGWVLEYTLAEPIR